jgi:uncharacterized phage protein (TIGR01671 family)
MREIKFQGKRINDGKWILGSLIKDEHGNCYIGEFIEAKEDGRAILTSGRRHGKTLNRFAAMGFCMVDPETVGQFSGSRDKNGQEIYEGHKLRVKSIDYDYDYETVVEQDVNGCLSIDLPPENEFDCAHIGWAIEWIKNDNGTVEIIGNIHDNPKTLTTD